MMDNKVLLVEDDLGFADSVTNAIKGEDIFLYHRTEGKTALDLLAEDDAIKVVILDLQLPDYNGKTLAREITDKYKNVKVIILTGHPNLISDQEVINLGIHSYLEKPVTSSELRISIKNAVMSAQLQNRERMVIIGGLSSALAHDINNALRPILTNAQFIEESLPLANADNLNAFKEKAQGELKIIINSTRHCAEIVNNLMDFAREKEVDKQNVDINEVIKDSLNILRNNKNITINSSFANNLIYRANSDQLRRVFNNVLKNSLEAMPDGGEIRIETSLRENCIYIEFIDTGSGISKGDLNKVFDPSYSLKKGKGMGLGLAIVKNIVEGSYGGTVEIDSKKFEWTKVMISLPIPT